MHNFSRSQETTLYLNDLALKRAQLRGSEPTALIFNKFQECKLQRIITLPRKGKNSRNTRYFNIHTRQDKGKLNYIC